MPAKKRGTKKTTKKPALKAKGKKVVVKNKKKVSAKRKVNTVKKKIVAKNKSNKKKVVTKKKKVVAPKKKAVSKKKVVKKISVEIKEDKDPLTFELQDHEIEEMLAYEIKTTAKKDNEQNRMSLVEELTNLIPHDEPIVTSKTPKTHNLIVKDIRERHIHSPFVIDLKKMAKEKEEKEMKKAFVNHRYDQVSERLDRLKRATKFTVKRAKQSRVKAAKIDQQTITVKKHTVITTKTSRKEAKNLLAITKEEVSEQFTVTPTFRLPVHWYKTAVVFAALALLVIAPIKGFTYVKDVTNSKDQMMYSSQQALADIKAAGQAIADTDTATAKIKFEQAELNFSKASEEINSINTFISAAIKIIPVTGKYLTDAERLTQIGQKSAVLGKDLSDAFDAFYKQPDLSLTEKITVLKKQTDEILLPQIAEINLLLNKVDSKVLPEDKIDTFDQARTTLVQIENDLTELSTFSNYLMDILGHNYKRKYLVVFQNNNELRATGGFMGSLAIVEMRNGEIENIDIPGGGTYDFQGSLKEHVTAPTPLHLINSKWELQDSNWFFDFPTSAEKIQWFYEKSANESVDGVIAINANLLEKILKHTAPIEMPQYNKTITADNFIKETQMQVEYQYNKEDNKPKQFIADLTPKLLEQLFDSEKTDLLGIVNELKNGLKTKDIQMYFNDEYTQNKISEYDWSGEIKDTSLDYLAVVNTNIAGGKTDKFIEQLIDHEINIADDGSIIDTVSISRRHNGSTDDIFSGVRNVNYQRIYVPQGAVLLEASGFNPPALALFETPEDYLKADFDLIRLEKNKVIEPESQTTIHTINNKTVFAGWTQTDPGETTVVKLKYKLPFELKTPEKSLLEKVIGNQPESKLFTAFYQKQAGCLNTQISSVINIPENFKTIWNYPMDGLNHEAKRTFDLETDKLHGIIIQSK